MKNLIRKITESRMAKLALAGSGLVYLTGCANVNPNMAMGTLVGGTLLGGIPGANPAQMAIGQAAVAGGALSYQRSSYENAARQVGSGENSNSTYASINTAEETQLQKIIPTELILAGNWVDVNRDGYPDDGEIFERDKTIFNGEEDKAYIILRGDSTCNLGKVFTLELYSIDGKLLDQKVRTFDKNSSTIFIYFNIKNSQNGDYRVIVKTEDDSIYSKDFKIIMRNNSKIN